MAGYIWALKVTLLDTSGHSAWHGWLHLGTQVTWLATSGHSRWHNWLHLGTQGGMAGCIWALRVTWLDASGHQPLLAWSQAEHQSCSPRLLAAAGGGDAANWGRTLSDGSGGWGVSSVGGWGVSSGGRVSSSAHSHPSPGHPGSVAPTVMYSPVV